MLGVHDSFRDLAVLNDGGEEGEREGKPCRGAFGEAWESRATRAAKARRAGETHSSATRVEVEGVGRGCGELRFSGQANLPIQWFVGCSYG